MKRHTPHAGATALALLMATAAGATPASNASLFPGLSTGSVESATILLAQAEEPQAPEELLPEEQPAVEEAPAEPEAAQEPEAASEPEPAPEPQAEQPAAEQESPASEDAPAAEPAPEQPPVAEPETPAAAQPEPEVPPAAEQPAAPEAEPAPKAENGDAPAPDGASPAEPDPAAPVEPDAEAPAAPESDPSATAHEAPALDDNQEPAATPPAADGESPPAEAAPAEPIQPPPDPAQPPAADPGVATDPADTPAEAPRDGSQAAAEATPDTGQTAPVEDGEAAPAEPGDAPARTEAPDDGADAPVLDSNKRRRGPRSPDGQAVTPEPEQPPAVQPAQSAPAPDSDRAAQEAAQPAEIQPVRAEEGWRRDRAPEERQRRRERPRGSEVLREIGDRVIIQFDGQVAVESNDRPRITRGAREVFYEDLPRDRIRETIVRPDGTRVITVRNAYGDVIRRSRIAPDEREYVLVYVEEENYERVRDWRDPGLDLPPLRLDIPEDEYILEAVEDQSAETYFDFLEQPPVERVERLYSVDEVKRSARIRDKTRRVDLDTLTFEFGSATIPEDQIPRLESVAQAMERLLAKNPAETFLIEGHTDAVGSDLANLALSDRRAEAVADALSTVFAIPPENLSTQGYGEEYLKVRTQSQERENRRVAIRRITALVAPVASAQ